MTKIVPAFVLAVMLMPGVITNSFGVPSTGRRALPDALKTASVSKVQEVLKIASRRKIIFTVPGMNT